MIPVRSERIYSIQSALKCARRELKLYIFTEVYDVTLVRARRRRAAQIHEWMIWNKVNFSGFPCSGSREQWTPCREQWTPCREQWTLCREQWTLCREQWTLCREQRTLCREHVSRNTVHARSALLTSWLSESGVLTKRDMQNMQSGGARGLELRTSVLVEHLHYFIIYTLSKYKSNATLPELTDPIRARLTGLMM